MKIYSLPVVIVTLALATPLLADNVCQTGYTICSPAGATSSTTPQIGSADFANLFNDLLASSLPASRKRTTSASTTSLCCAATTSCLTLANLALPFCYDPFTTNFALPDGSTGTVAFGTYTSSGGDTANLETGDYKLANGQTGNIYSNYPAAKPNTGTEVLPTQFTSSGVGSAIPVTALGGFVTLTYTTTLPASTIPATTVLPTTLPGSTVSTTEVLPETISTSISNSLVLSTLSITTTEVSTAPATTILGTTKVATTVAGLVSTVVTTSAVGSSTASASASASASTTKKSAASRSSHIDGLYSLGGLGVAAVAIFLLC
ncbi:hypothetical protein G7Y89_g9325 [Cudoniella acicularis]|uniref:Uncharacterized protein n=1 Tax=Cudoniella acicularis TaxID=354080 RepID=A0A8H4W056_9HELO|nr:hypothetical protein G7Y89_g9325 [Cudoniella acicularis]